MTDQDPTDARPDSDEVKRKAQARRRLDEVFGDVLPEQSSDDVDDPRERRTSDDWLRAQVPPHHG
ncbi:MAG: hypothetical protein M9946_12275 [Nocardioidaceae bacterium]|nr:hypothetical protein [Nocardioidaceae bacterium]